MSGKRSLESVLREHEDEIDTDDGMSFEESWDLSASIMVHQDIRDGGTPKLAARLARQLNPMQLLELIEWLKVEMVNKGGLKNGSAKG